MVVWSVLMFALLAIQQPETMSLLDQPLFAPRLSSDERSTREGVLAAARAAHDRDRGNVDAALALARAEMALGRVGNALEVLTHALESKPDDPRLLLERGRGLIVIRKFELAGKELRKPAETIPEAACALGLAQYLAADFAHARESLTKCPNPGVFAYLADSRIGPSAMPRPDVSRELTPDASARPAETDCGKGSQQLDGSGLHRGRSRLRANPQGRGKEAEGKASKALAPDLPDYRHGTNFSIHWMRIRSL